MATSNSNPESANRRRSLSVQRRRGAVLMEAALVLPFCLMFILGLFEYARYVMFLQILNNAAREGARYAVMHVNAVTIDGTTYGNATSDVTTIVSQVLAGQQLTSQTTQVYLSDSLGNNTGTWQNAQTGESVSVQITGNYKLVTPSLLYAGSTFPVTTRTTMRVESN
jgi:Flp pilus assembly protein TadG